MGLKNGFGRIKSCLTVYSRRRTWLIKTLAAAALAAVPAGTGLALASSPAQPETHGAAGQQASSSLNANYSDAGKATSSSVHQQTSVSSSTTGTKSSAEVTVNGKKIQVPENGSIDKSINENGTTTRVHLEKQSDNNGGNSSLNVSVESNSSLEK